MSNCEMVDHQKVCRITLTQSGLRDRKNRCVLRGLTKHENISNAFILQKKIPHRMTQWVTETQNAL